MNFPNIVLQWFLTDIEGLLQAYPQACKRLEYTCSSSLIFFSFNRSCMDFWHFYHLLSLSLPSFMVSLALSLEVFFDTPCLLHTLPYHTCNNFSILWISVIFIISHLTSLKFFLINVIFSQVLTTHQFDHFFKIIVYSLSLCPPRHVPIIWVQV